MIVEDLGAWTTRAGIGHLPEIIRGKRRTFVIANTDDSIFRHTHHVTPQCVGLIVSAVHRHQQTFGGNSQTWVNNSQAHVIASFLK